VTSDRLDEAHFERALQSQSETPESPVKRADTVTLALEERKTWRRAAGMHIDAETEEVRRDYRQVLDPYGEYSEIPKEADCVGRPYFARSPGMGVWIEFGDLPEATRDALWEKRELKLAFPAGLDLFTALTAILGLDHEC